MTFDWDIAQAYERAWGLGWLYGEDSEPINPAREFFHNDVSAYGDFLASLTGKTVLEVGCGPCPIVGHWDAPARVILIEPLLDAYASRIDLTRPVEKHAARAEDVLPTLAGQIDGAIVCRNCLDHTADPWLILRLLLAAAAPGCRLLFWCDYQHAAPDEGHRSWAESYEDIAATIISAGFAIDYEVSIRPVPATHTLDWGCVATKRVGQ